MRRVGIICVFCLLMTGVVAWTSTAAGASTPVPLLGNQSVAATHDGGSGTSEAFGYTAGATGTATSAGVYLDTTDGVRVGLYADQSGRPGVRLDQGSTTVNTAGWVTVSLPAGVHMVKGTRYWIAIAGTRGGGTVGYRDAGSSGSTLDYSGNGMASPYSVQQQWNSNPASVYIAGNASTPPVAPSNSVAPTVTGTAQQGQTLTDGPGTWAGTAPITYTYQWQRNATNISGATSSTYTLSAADVGATVDVTVRATNAGGSASASSAPTARVSGLTPTAPVNTTLQVVTGTDTQGQTLATTNGAWSGSPTSYAYQWRDCDTSGNSCTDVPGANSSSYVLAGSDVGHTMRLVLTATNSSGSTPATSLATGVVGMAGSAPTSLSPGTLSGTDTQGQTLTTTNGSWTGSPTAYTYQWQDCNTSGAACSSITGATAVSYLLGSGDVGHTVRAVVSASNAFGSATATSAASAAVTATSGGLPPGVTLRAIDGGPNYFAANGFTAATNTAFNGMSWDDPRFFPIAQDDVDWANPSGVTAAKALGVNVGVRVYQASDIAAARAAGIWLIPSADDVGYGGFGAETAGWHIEEPSCWNALVTGGCTYDVVQRVAALGSLASGRPLYLSTGASTYFSGLAGAPGDGSEQAAMTAPIGSSGRHLDIPSVDDYPFAGRNIWGHQYYVAKAYGLTCSPQPCDPLATPDQAARGSNYGDYVDAMRGLLPTKADGSAVAPVSGAYIETEDGLVGSGGVYILPQEWNWAVWSEIVHGTRQLLYFSAYGHGSSTLGFDQNILPGATTSMYNQAQATDALIKQLAPVINSPFALSYATVTPAGYVFPTPHPVMASGPSFDIMTKRYQGGFYIFATTRYSQTLVNQTATFQTADGYTGPVTVVNENRTVPAVNGKFTDVFAKASDVHIYQIP